MTDIDRLDQIRRTRGRYATHPAFYDVNWLLDEVEKLQRRISWLARRNQAREDQSDRLYARSVEAEDERDALQARLDKVRKLADRWEQASAPCTKERQVALHGVARKLRAALDDSGGGSDG